MAPIIKQGTFSMTGAPGQFNIGFDADIVFGYLESGTSLKPWLWWSQTSWVKRTQRCESSDSLPEAIKDVRDGKLIIGDDALANVAGGTLHYLALKDNKSALIGDTGWIGSPVSWSPIVGKTAPSAVFVKRDNNEAPVARLAGMTGTESVKMEGTGQIADGILSINADGSLTVGKDPAVNQLSGGAIGEGHDCLSFWQQAGLIEVVGWVGNGTANRVIAHTVANPVAAIVVSMSNNTKAALKLASMGTKLTHATATALIDNAITTLNGGLTIGADTRYNNNSERYYALILGASDVAAIKDRMLFASDPGEVYLRGASSSNINCGTDNSLSMTGAFSLEWWGKTMWTTPTNGGSEAFYFMARSNSDEGRADSDGLANGAGTRRDGTWSWALFGKGWDDLNNWDAPMFGVVTTNYNNADDNASSENDIRTKPWRLGIKIPLNQRFHVVVTHDGLGLWRFYFNGKLVKQRYIDMRNVTLADDAGTRVNAGAGTGHRTVLGARQGTSSIGLPALMLMGGAAVYNTALTVDQAAQLYRRNFLGDTTAADIDPVERWLPSAVSGTTLTAAKNTANNGTLTMAAKVKLGQF
jgi:hypothetical protein